MPGLRAIVALAAACLFALLQAPNGAHAQPAAAVSALPVPKLVWETATDIAVPPGRSDERPAPLANVLALAARRDGGAVIVAAGLSTQPPGTLRVLSFDAAGKIAFDILITRPGGPAASGTVVHSVAVTAEIADRTWLLETWSKTENPDEVDDPAPSRLIGLDATGKVIATTILPRRVAGTGTMTTQRTARVLRALPDGSLLAAGTVWHAPPVWWLARFTTSGSLLHEQASRRFPDYVEDARGNDDGGYSLLMIDAERGPETVTIRRYGANGRLATRQQMPDLNQSLRCAVLVGAGRQLRIMPDYDAGERGRSDAIWHEAGRGQIAKVDLGSLGCDSLDRLGTTVLMMGADLPVQDDAAPTFIAFRDGRLLWRLPQTELAQGAPTLDGGAVVLRLSSVGQKPTLILGRYATP